jgi:DNA invertase Pin-like site-specific DNA recombinase
MTSESTTRTVTLTKIRRDEAFLRTIVDYGVPIRTVAVMLGCSRQTIYRQMQEARSRIRKLQAKLRAERAAEEKSE